MENEKIEIPKKKSGFFERFGTNLNEIKSGHIDESLCFLLWNVSANRNVKAMKRIFGIKMPNVKDSNRSL